MPKKDFFIDFHCHASLRAINTPLAGGDPNLWEKTHNEVIDSVIGRWARVQTVEIAKSSQTNFYAYAKAKTRVVFDALYPVEKGWFEFRKLPSYIVGKKSRDEILISATGIDRDRLKELRGKKDYFNELEECYHFLVNGQGPSPDNKFSYRIAADFHELQQLTEKDPNCIVVIPTIEGAHALGAGSPNTIGLEIEKHKEKLSKNIRRMKKWDYPPFFITFAHHFWNQLCGHAKSMKPPIHLVFNQTQGADLGMQELGWHVLHELLSKENGKRVLIDIKHMSVKSRTVFYDYIAEHNKNNPHDTIPIICSHSGVNGYKTLAESIAEEDNGKKLKGDYYNSWSINLCKEEIKIIYQSGGVIGIMMDKGLLAGPDTLLKIANISNPKKKIEALVKLVLDNIFFIISTVNKKSAWDMIVLGTDYDGLITHLDCYEDAEHIPEIKRDLVKYLTKHEYKKKLWFELSPEEIVSKVMTENAWHFLQRHYI